MKKVILITALTITAIFLQFSLLTTEVNAQSDVFDQGTVWQMTTIRIDANMGEEYLKRISKTWKKSMDMAKAEGLILSYKILNGAAANAQDFNLMLMVEFKNMATLDRDPAKDAKWKAISDKIEAGPDYEESLKRYGEIRQLLGSKLMREIYLK